MPSCPGDVPVWGSASRVDGFTVLELLASLALLVLFLAAGLAGLSVALRGDQQASFLTRATLLGHSRLAAADLQFPLRPGSTARQIEDGFAWWAEVRLDRSVRLPDGGIVRAFRVRITVTDPDPRNGRSVSFTTIALRTEEARS